VFAIYPLDECIVNTNTQHFGEKEKEEDGKTQKTHPKKLKKTQNRSFEMRKVAKLGPQRHGQRLDASKQTLALKKRQKSAQHH
jgi:hypothetical protein